VQNTPPTNASTQNQNIEASFSVLVLSVASSAAFNLGMSPDPQTGNLEMNKPMAKFHIDLLLMLKEKTKSHLNSDETRLLDSLLSDLQLKFVQAKTVSDI
jgi:hypothetical protein